MKVFHISLIIIILIILICTSKYKTILKFIKENFNDDIDIYLVSLDKDIERRNELNLKVDYTYSFDGSQLDLEKLKTDGIIDKSCKMTKGEIGCYLSHVHMLKKSLTQNKKILVIEDDIKTEKDTFDKINKVLKIAPKDFELLFIGYNYYEKYEFENNNLVHGTQSYIVNTKLLTEEKINKLYPIKEPIDVTLPKVFKCYITVPKIIELSAKFGGISNTQAIR